MASRTVAVTSHISDDGRHRVTSGETFEESICRSRLIGGQLHGLGWREQAHGLLLITDKRADSTSHRATRIARNPALELDGYQTHAVPVRTGRIASVYFLQRWQARIQTSVLSLGNSALQWLLEFFITSPPSDAGLRVEISVSSF